MSGRSSGASRNPRWQEQPFVFKTPTSKTPSKPLSRFTFTAPASIFDAIKIDPSAQNPWELPKLPERQTKVELQDPTHSLSSVGKMTRPLTTMESLLVELEDRRFSSEDQILILGRIRGACSGALPVPPDADDVVFSQATAQGKANASSTFTFTYIPTATGSVRADKIEWANVAKTYVAKPVQTEEISTQAA